MKDGHNLVSHVPVSEIVNSTILHHQRLINNLAGKTIQKNPRIINLAGKTIQKNPRIINLAGKTIQKNPRIYNRAGKIIRKNH